MRCLICDSPRLHNHGRIASSIREGHSKIDILECGECRVCFSDPMPTPNELAQFYESDLYKEVYGSEDTDWQRKQHQIDMARLGKPRGKLLDVGCSFGLALEVALELGWDAEGLEIDPMAASVAHERVKALGYDTNVHVGSVDELDKIDHHFAAITMSHVFEHLVNPLEALSLCRDALEPGGVLAIQSPNRLALMTQRSGEDHRPIEHPFYWCYPAIFKAIKSVGMIPKVPPAYVAGPMMKRVALGIESMSSKAIGWGIKSTLEIHAVKCLSTCFATGSVNRKARQTSAL